MKKLLLLVVLSVGLLQAQTIKFKCLDYFDGIILKEEVIWDIPKEITKKTVITITDNVIKVPSKKLTYSYDQIIQNEQMEDHKRLVYLVKDNNGTDAYVIFLFYDEYTHIYFQYADIIFGYNIIEQKKLDW